ncbi:MAG: rhodanese-like domain-containing protein [Flavobacteriaceae bacterium]|nr:rhodanese-like domain-containing protein [Flavobacteriaceae bacterium]
MNCFLVILCFVTTVFSYSCMNHAENEIQVITAEEMQELSEINDVQLVDFNAPLKQEETLIEDSQNIDYLSPSFEQDLKKLDKSKPVIVYCESAKHNTKCKEKMEEAGFVKIYDLDSTIAKWKYKG